MKPKFYTLKQLALEYGICVKTLRKRLEPIRDELNTIGFDEDGEAIVLEKSNILYSPKQIQIVFKHLGDPTKEK